MTHDLDPNLETLNAKLKECKDLHHERALMLLDRTKFIRSRYRYVHTLCIHVIARSAFLHYEYMMDLVIASLVAKTRF